LSFDFLYNVCLKHFSIQEELSKMWSELYIGLCVKYPLYLSYFKDTFFSCTDFQRILECQISWISVQWEPRCSMRTDIRTDRHDKAHIHFSQLFERIWKPLVLDGTCNLNPSIAERKGDYSLLIVLFNVEQINSLTAMLNKKIDTEIIRHICTWTFSKTGDYTINKNVWFKTNLISLCHIPLRCTSIACENCVTCTLTHIFNARYTGVHTVAKTHRVCSFCHICLSFHPSVRSYIFPSVCFKCLPPDRAPDHEHLFHTLWCISVRWSSNIILYSLHCLRLFFKPSDPIVCITQFSHACYVSNA
jgi:hypothetical protein